MALFSTSFPNGEFDEFSKDGKRPVIFDVVDPEGESLLPEGVRLVLKVNPTSMSIKYAQTINRIQTRGGFVEQHWGDGEISIDFEMVTGYFMRVYIGTVSNTDPAVSGVSRRDTLGYDSYLDMLSLFHNNGSIFDIEGNIVLQGKVKITFDGGIYTGWFSSFNVSEDATKPYMFTMSASFTCAEELQNWRSL
jgi:hypothetical protein